MQHIERMGRTVSLTAGSAALVGVTIDDFDARHAAAIALGSVMIAGPDIVREARRAALHRIGECDEHPGLDWRGLRMIHR